MTAAAVTAALRFVLGSAFCALRAPEREFGVKSASSESSTTRFLVFFLPFAFCLALVPVAGVTVLDLGVLAIGLAESLMGSADAFEVVKFMLS